MLPKASDSESGDESGNEGSAEEGGANSDGNINVATDDNNVVKSVAKKKVVKGKK